VTHKLAAAAGSDTGGSARFYSDLYIGLWHEAHGDEQVCALLRVVGGDAGCGVWKPGVRNL
jgi:hypothetical protein